MDHEAAGIELENVLPAASFGTLTTDMIREPSPLRTSISGEIPFQYFEVGRKRFGWLADPAGIEGEVGDVMAPDGRIAFGPVHWSVLLRRQRSGWRVVKALR